MNKKKNYIFQREPLLHLVDVSSTRLRRPKCGKHTDTASTYRSMTPPSRSKHSPNHTINVFSVLLGRLRDLCGLSARAGKVGREEKTQKFGTNRSQTTFDSMTATMGADGASCRWTAKYLPQNLWKGSQILQDPEQDILRQGMDV